MRSPVFTRVLRLLVIYCGIFIALVLIQFPERAAFTQGAGARALPELDAFSPDDFILPQARTHEAYSEAIAQWRDRNFSLWNRTISEQNNEDVVAAFAGEAVARGTYSAAVAAIPRVFLEGRARTYESSVYLGGLEQAYRSLITREQETHARISLQINEMSPEFLTEPRVFEYLAIRGYRSLIDDGANAAGGIDPAAIAPEIIPGILEGYTYWKLFRPAEANPFERLAGEACLAISAALRMDDNGSSVFAFDENRENPEFSLRLGKALLAYAEAVRNPSWAGIGRSLILSALSGNGASGGSSPLSGPDAAKLYRILAPVNTYPRAVVVDAPVNSIWAWTAAQELSASRQNNILDIAVTFPANETHYMIIRGVRPFSRIQLYQMDFRTDAQFERYDSSGWRYISQEQILTVKMKHRSTVEHIRIIF